MSTPEQEALQSIQLPLTAAATAPRGNAPTDWRVALDGLAIIALPLGIPNLALWILRGELSLVDLSFGFVGLSAAVVTRSLTSGSTAWRTAAYVSLLLTTVFVAVAVGTDPYESMKELVILASELDSTAVTDIDGVQAMAVEVAERGPTVLQWVGTSICGLVLVAVTGFLIWKREA